MRTEVVKSLRENTFFDRVGVSLEKQTYDPKAFASLKQEANSAHKAATKVQEKVERKEAKAQEKQVARAAGSRR